MWCGVRAQLQGRDLPGVRGCRDWTCLCWPRKPAALSVWPLTGVVAHSLRALPFPLPCVFELKAAGLVLVLWHLSSLCSDCASFSFLFPSFFLLVLCLLLKNECAVLVVRLQLLLLCFRVVHVIHTMFC